MTVQEKRNIIVNRLNNFFKEKGLEYIANVEMGCINVYSSEELEMQFYDMVNWKVHVFKPFNLKLLMDISKQVY